LDWGDPAKITIKIRWLFLQIDISTLSHRTVFIRTPLARQRLKQGVASKFQQGGPTFQS
jgi:hypothetical protein